MDHCGSPVVVDRHVVTDRVVRHVENQLVRREGPCPIATRIDVVGSPPFRKRRDRCRDRAAERAALRGVLNEWLTQHRDARYAAEPVRIKSANCTRRPPTKVKVR